MSLYTRECKRCEVWTNHEDSFPSDEEDEFVSVHEEDARGRFIYCRLCERGHSPADNELDTEVVDEVLEEYPRVAEEMTEDDPAKDFIQRKILEGHRKKYEDRFFHPKTYRVLTNRYLD